MDPFGKEGKIEVGHDENVDRRKGKGEIGKRQEEVKVYNERFKGRRSRKEKNKLSLRCTKVVETMLRL